MIEYEGFDVSVGFDNYEEIKKYLYAGDKQEFEYDIALIDVDSVENFERFNLQKSEKNYFVTSFDLYSLKKGLEIINGLPAPIKLTKIIFSKDILKEDNEYLNYVSLGSKAIWNEDNIVYLPMDNGDQNIIIENQRVAKIGIRKLSVQYKESLCYVVQDILENDVPKSKIKRDFKLLEKDV